MQTNILAVLLILTLSGCAGIRFCDRHEVVKKTDCKPWDPATISGAASR